MISVEVFMDIIAMHRQGHSIRSIARKTGLHRKTVKRHLESNSFPQYRKKKREQSILDPYEQIIRDFLEQDDYKATWIHDRLKHMGYTGSYDTIKVFVRKIKEQQARLAYARFETEPGLQAQVDWGDFQIREPDGKSSTVYAFVMVLGYSRAMHVEFVDNCTLETFMDCHIHAFHHLKGVPAEILYDNMKNVVIGRKDGKAIFNTEFLHLAHHYGFQPKLCPPYSPWVKGKVERPIDYIRERFWRGYVFESVEKGNRDMITWLKETANQRTHGTHHQPVIQRWEQEISCLGKLPPADYDTSIKVFRKVYKDCQISYNGNRYEVPYHVVGRKVMLKIKGTLIRIYHDQQLLVSYREAQGKHNLVGNPAFSEQLKRDKEQIRRKYGRKKGKATRGLTTWTLFPQVARRELAEYERFAQGGVIWDN
jgi:transposase